MDSSEKNFSQPGCVDRKTSVKMKGAVQIKHAKVALLIERGEPVGIVSKETRLSEGRIHHLLEDPNSFVNTEIRRIRKEKFEAQDRLLANIRNKELQLRYKALQHLESMIESPDKDERNKAIDQIMKTIARMTKAANQPQSRPYTMDDFILEANKTILAKRKERGLPLDSPEDGDEAAVQD